MDMPKSVVIKSKSSNSAISKSVSSSRKTKQEYKSRSNADFPPIGGFKKKKGMYVEKRSTKVSLRSQHGTDSPTRPKPYQPPRRSKNKFMTSILTILDQDTQGTQTGTSREVTRPPSSKSSKIKRRRKHKVEDTDLTVESIDIDDDKSQGSIRIQGRSAENTEKKNKFRSKVLNEIRSDNEKLFILAPKKVVQSINSDDTLTGQKKSSIYDQVTEGFISQLADEADIAKQLLQHWQAKDPLRQNITTEIKKTEKFVAEKKDKGLYSFFVNLLETTYSVYNVNDEFGIENDDSKSLVIDESVAQKLKVEPEEKVSYQSVIETKTDGYEIKDDGMGWNDAETFQATMFANMGSRSKSPFHKSVRTNSPNSTRTKSPTVYPDSRRRMKSASFSYTAPLKKDIFPKTQSVISPKKSFYKKRSKKETLLNILREELTKPAEPVEEPQNMFQALKIIARNKRKAIREIRFADTDTEITNSNNEKCRFKGRKVICSSTKSGKKNKKGLPSKNVTRTIPTFPGSDEETEYEEKDLNYATTDVDMDQDDDSDSYHSIEVKEYETDYLPGKKMQNKEIFFAKNSNVYFQKDLDYIKQHEEFERRLMNPKSSVESVYNTKELSKKVGSESDLGSDIEHPSVISLPISED